ncbi:MAG: histidine triad (HIT) family protein [Gammaproteobacteria bacterium]|jgi:histidine triad (HIT) family protein
MSEQNDCLFCKIISGDVPSFKVFEDEQTLAFMDINPANDGHCLVIPKEHARDLCAISEEAVAAVARSARRVAIAVQATLQPEGVNLVQCNGPAAGQSVYHFHMHVLPRREGDGLQLNWGIKAGDMQAIGKLAARIAGKIESM